MLETSTNGAKAADEAVAGSEDQGGVAELGFVAGGRPAAGAPGPAGVPDPELVEQAKRRTFTAKYKLEILGQGGRVHEAGRGRRAFALRGPVHVASDLLAQAGPRRCAEGARSPARPQAGRPARPGHCRADAAG